MRCDFCSDRPVVAAYPCRDFTLPDCPEIGSRGAWAACAECARLIDTDQREALASRAWRRLIDRIPVVGEASASCGLDSSGGLAVLRALQDLFFTHRAGEPVPVGLN